MATLLSAAAEVTVADYETDDAAARSSNCGGSCDGVVTTLVHRGHDASQSGLQGPFWDGWIS
jgi:hypothetical protein